MAGVNFFQDQPQGLPPAGDPNDWGGQQQRGMAAMLLRQMPTNQGQMVNGNYVAPSGSEYALKIAQALMQGKQNYQRQNEARAMGVLNSGGANLVDGMAPPQLPLDKFKGFVGGMFGGGG